MLHIKKRPYLNHVFFSLFTNHFCVKKCGHTRQNIFLMGASIHDKGTAHERSYTLMYILFRELE